ncbi:tyrosine-protein kinase domain-containing protein [Deinococcus aquatilis]|uniref:tyrosine-protein kinase domain-containing protein n=1 Tax=Deinococcus aquatilis TaxID=519440 RepID=UPI000399E924
MNETQFREVDLSFLWRAVKRYLPLVIALPLLLGLLTFALTRQQPPVYEATATLLATNSQGAQDGLTSQALVSAPPLPEGVLPQALQSDQILGPVIEALGKESTVSQTERDRLTQQLTRELRDQKLEILTLASRLDFNGNGTYTLRARARDSRAAQLLANLTSRALVDWDRGRGLETIRRGLQGFDAQLTELDDQLAGAGSTPAERQSLQSRRARIQDSRTQLAILENSAVSVLAPLVAAQAPRLPVAPKPLRNGVLAGLVGLLLAVAVAALSSVSDRTIRHEDDLLFLNLPTLATLPRVRRRDVVLRGIVHATRQAGSYEAIGFLRINLLSALKDQPHPVVMITSTFPGEGKSSVTATLADGLASSGQRVLIIDADLRRGTQAEVWRKYAAATTWRPLSGSGGARTTQQALLRPGDAEVLRVEDNVDMLPAGPGLTNSLSVFSQADLTAALAMWRQHYDVVLVDTAPLLALADGLVVGRYVDGVLMVVEYGKTNVKATAAALRRAQGSGLRVLGFVLNKADVADEGAYGYSSNYSAISEGVRA